MFLKPEIGLSRLGSGFSAPTCGLPPTWAMLITRAAATQVKMTGAAASAAEPICSEIRGPRPRWSTTFGVAMSWNASRSEVSSVATRCGAVALRAKSAANMTTAPLRSPDLATWPFLRASERFFGVAFSVLSPAAMSGDPQRLQRGAHAVLELVGDPAGDERERHADDEQADRDLGREADGEDVELRDDARDGAERGVGDDHGEHHRGGELDRGDEDAGERALDARDHRAECRRPGERDEVVGVVQALDHPGVAVDRDEHGDPDERVRLRQYRPVVAGHGGAGPPVRRARRVVAGPGGADRPERKANERLGQGAGGPDRREEDRQRVGERQAHEE